MKLYEFIADLDKINVVYDIGAHRGMFIENSKKYLPNASYYAFEPNKKLDYNAPDVYWHTVLLADKNEIKKFYYKNGTGDSYYKETDKTGQYNKDKHEIIDYLATTLEDYKKEKALPDPDLIKIDTQGSEIDILSNANISSKTKYIMCEIPSKEFQYNEGAPTHEEYLKFFDNMGFKNIIFLKDHKKNWNAIDVVVQHDILATREE